VHEVILDSLSGGNIWELEKHYCIVLCH